MKTKEQSGISATLNAQVTAIRADGITLLAGSRELILAFEHFPCFLNTRVRQILHVEMPSGDRLFWPDLGISLEIGSILHPESYPLLSRSLRNNGTAPGPLRGAPGAVMVAAEALVEPHGAFTDRGPEFKAQMQAAKRVMSRYRNALRKLAMGRGGQESKSRGQSKGLLLRSCCEVGSVAGPVEEAWDVKGLPGRGRKPKGANKRARQKRRGSFPAHCIVWEPDIRRIQHWPWSMPTSVTRASSASAAGRRRPSAWKTWMRVSTGEIRGGKEAKRQAEKAGPEGTSLGQVETVTA